MLFLKDGNDAAQPRAMYLLSDDMEAMLSRQVDGRLREHGVVLNDAAEIAKDMHFLRAKRQLCEQLSRQLWLLAMRGLLLGLGALILLGLKEYIA